MTPVTNSYEFSIEQQLSLASLDEFEVPLEVREREAFERIESVAQDDTRRALYGIVRELKRRHERIENAAAYLKIVQDEFDLIVEREKGPRAFLEEQVKRLAKELAGDSKHHDITGYARVQFTTHKPSVRIGDPEKVVQYLKEHELKNLIRVKEEPMANDVKALPNASSIPGMEEVPGGETANIQWGKA